MGQIVHRALAVDGAAQRVEHAAQSALAHRGIQAVAGGGNFHPLAQTLAGRKHDAAHRRFIDVLRHLHGALSALCGHGQRFLQGRQLASGKLDEIYIVYTKIQNALTSEPVMERLLPLDRRFLQPAPKGLGDPKGEVELVPDAWTVFEQIAPIYMHGMIFGAMTESFCAEQSARMTAMDSATKSANDMIRDLQLEYNRTRQGSITQEITEIIGGAAAVQDRT